MRGLRWIYQRLSDPTIPMSVPMTAWVVIILVVLVVAAGILFFGNAFN